MTAPAPQWPDHYAAKDIETIDRAIKWMAERSYTPAALARLARISSSSLNQIIKGVYATSPTKLLQNVESAMRHADEVSGAVVAPVETSVYKLVQTCCGMARRYRNFSVCTGFVGTGKTFALKHYAATHPNTHLIEATPTMTPQSPTGGAGGNGREWAVTARSTIEAVGAVMDSGGTAALNVLCKASF